MNLFKQKPTINFYPEFSDGDVKVLKSCEKNVVTLDIGPFRAKETILQNGNGAIYHSEQLRALTPHRCTYGYDILVYVGRALFIHCRNEQQIMEELGNKNVLISPRQIGFLDKKFIVYLAIAHQQSQQLLKHKIRPLLRRKLKGLEKISGDDPQAVRTLAAGIDSGCMDTAVMDKMPAIAAYAMIHWTLDTSELEGYGFPFDCPHLIFYQRLKVLRDIVENRLIRNRVLSKLWGPLAKIV